MHMCVRVCAAPCTRCAHRGVHDPHDGGRPTQPLSHTHRTTHITPTASYNALLEVCSRTNDVERGEDVIDRMQADEVGGGPRARASPGVIPA